MALFRSDPAVRAAKARGRRALDVEEFGRRHAEAVKASIKGGNAALEEASGTAFEQVLTSMAVEKTLDRMGITDKHLRERMAELELSKVVRLRQLAHFSGGEPDSRQLERMGKRDPAFRGCLAEQVRLLGGFGYWRFQRRNGRILKSVPIYELAAKTIATKRQMTERAAAGAKTKRPKAG